MASTPACCVVGLGANIGFPRESLRSAVERLSRAFELRGVSPLYESAAVGPVQPRFLNAATSLSFSGEPRHLLGELLQIEQEAGRVRRERWGPRTLDLDLLWIEGRSIAEPGLTVPHPRLSERAFALCPLLDLVPEARDPGTGLALASFAAALRGQDCRRVARWVGGQWLGG